MLTPRAAQRWLRLVWLPIVVIAAACDNAAAPTALTPSDQPPSQSTLAGATIGTQPQDQTIASGGTATLTIAANGTAPLNYQWFVGSSGATSSPVGGATSASYTTPALTSTTSYWVRVSNAQGSADSVTAVVTVTAPPPPPPPPPPDPAAAFEDEVLVLVNQRRAAGAVCGGASHAPVPALYMHQNLRIAARGHSQDMAAQNYFSHTSLDGRTFSQRIRNAGYTGAAPLGENIAAGYPTPQSVVNGWMASPGHCVNIMSPGYRAIGVGYAHHPASTYGHYWTQSFGGS